jgi:CRISPR system Cascade subunit CasB
MSKLLERLRKYKEKDDREMMANLRCVLVDSKKHRAWPALNRLGVEINNDNLSYIAGLYATHPEHNPSTGNFGTTCKLVMKQRDQRTDDKLTPTERRFQHLLTATRDEVYGRVLRMVLLAKSEGIPVNYEKLESDLHFWGECIKTEWATTFWTNKLTDAQEETP